MATTDKKTILKVLEIVSSFYDVLMKDILSKSRSGFLIKPRFIAIYLLREKFHYSFPIIANAIGGREHTTAVHAYRTIKKALQEDSGLYREINDIDSIMKGQKVEFVKKEISYVIKKKIAPKKRFPKKINCILTEREKNILLAWQQGKTLEEIGRGYNITRERVRQIVKKSISKEISNKQLEGFEIDVGEFLRQKKDSHISLRKSNPSSGVINSVIVTRNKDILLAWRAGDTLNEIGQKFKLSAEYIRQIINKAYPNSNLNRREERWSRYYSRCRNCGTTIIPHHVNGFCEECSPRGLSDKKRQNFIINADNKCSSCGLLRADSFRKFGRDLYVTRKSNSLGDYLVMCRECFLDYTSKKMIEGRKNSRLENN